MTTIQGQKTLKKGHEGLLIFIPYRSPPQKNMPEMLRLIPDVYRSFGPKRVDR